MKVLLATPRGFCAGVDRAVDIVELALDVFGPPVYVKHAIVHNVHVVRRLKERGAVFVERVEDIPEGSRTVFSAHGSTVEEYACARERRLELVDATCPLVTKVHLEAKRFGREGYTIIVVGHRGHVEVKGTMSEAPGSCMFIERPEAVASLIVPDPEKVAVLTQTTLSVDETATTLEAIRRRFPNARFPAKADICYATTNRQSAAKLLAAACDVVLVVGSRTSSNSNRLVEVVRAAGISAQLIDDEKGIDPQWLVGRQTVGVTSGASVPEDLVEGVVAFLRTHGATSVETLVGSKEQVFFGLPQAFAAEIRKRQSGHPRLTKHHVKAGTTMTV